MKKFFLFLLLLLLTACFNGVKVSSRLNDIESYLQAAPDSALKSLGSIPKEVLSDKKLLARYALLYSMALDKNYIDVTDDSLARVAVDYYSKSRDKHHSMLSWYSLGRVQMNAGNDGGAIVSFTEAADLAEAIQEYHYLGLIYRNIGDLYGKQNDAKEALKYYSKSSSSFDIIEEYYYAIYSKYSLTLTYQVLGKKAERDSLIKVLDHYCLESQNLSFSSQVASLKGTFALLDSEENAAYAIEQIKKGRSYKTRSQDASYLSLAYSYLNLKDSSDYYRSVALQTAKTPLDSAKVYAIIYKAENKNGNYRIASYYQDLAFGIQNRIMNERESMLVSNSLTEYHQAKAIRSEAVVARFRITLILSALLFLSLLLFLLQCLKIRSLQNQEKDRLIAEQEERIQNDLAKTDEILAEVNRLKEEKDLVLSSLASSVLEQMSMVKEWADAYYGLTKEDKDPYRYLDDDSLEKKKEIIKRFRSSLEEVRNNEQWFCRIEEWVNQYKDGIMEKSRNTCSQPNQIRQPMDESDYRTMLLMFAGLPDKAIAFFLNLSYGAVRMRRLRYRSFFSKLPEKEASFFLNALS